MRHTFVNGVKGGNPYPFGMVSSMYSCAMLHGMVVGMMAGLVAVGFDPPPDFVGLLVGIGVREGTLVEYELVEAAFVSGGTGVNVTVGVLV